MVSLRFSLCVWMALSTGACEDFTGPGTADQDEIRPEVEREADEHNKLGVERDMLEAEVAAARDALREARAVHREAPEGAERQAASQALAQAELRVKKADLALKKFEASVAQ